MLVLELFIQVALEAEQHLRPPLLTAFDVRRRAARKGRAARFGTPRRCDRRRIDRDGRESIRREWLGRTCGRRAPRATRFASWPLILAPPAHPAVETPDAAQLWRVGWLRRARARHGLCRDAGPTFELLTIKAPNPFPRAVRKRGAHPHGWRRLGRFYSQISGSRDRLHHRTNQQIQPAT